MALNFSDMDLVVASKFCASAWFCSVLFELREVEFIGTQNDHDVLVSQSVLLPLSLHVYTGLLPERLDPKSPT